MNCVVYLLNEQENQQLHISITQPCYHFARNPNIRTYARMYLSMCNKWHFLGIYVYSMVYQESFAEQNFRKYLDFVIFAEKLANRCMFNRDVQNRASIRELKFHKIRETFPVYGRYFTSKALSHTTVQ